MVENHWLSETVRGRQMLELDVSELLAVEKQIWIERMLFSLAGDLEMISGCCEALACATLCEWVCHYVKVTAVFAGLMGMHWRFHIFPVDLVNP